MLTLTVLQAAPDIIVLGSSRLHADGFNQYAQSLALKFRRLPRPVSMVSVTECRKVCSEVPIRGEAARDINRGTPGAAHRARPPALCPLCSAPTLTLSTQTNAASLCPRGLKQCRHAAQTRTGSPCTEGEQGQAASAKVLPGLHGKCMRRQPDTHCCCCCWPWSGVNTFAQKALRTCTPKARGALLRSFLARRSENWPFLNALSEKYALKASFMLLAAAHCMVCVSLSFTCKQTLSTQIEWTGGSTLLTAAKQSPRYYCWNAGSISSMTEGCA